MLPHSLSPDKLILSGSAQIYALEFLKALAITIEFRQVLSKFDQTLVSLIFS